MTFAIYGLAMDHIERHEALALSSTHSRNLVMVEESLPFFLSTILGLDQGTLTVLVPCFSHNLGHLAMDIGRVLEEVQILPSMLRGFMDRPQTSTLRTRQLCPDTEANIYLLTSSFLELKTKSLTNQCSFKPKILLKTYSRGIPTQTHPTPKSLRTANCTEQNFNGTNLSKYMTNTKNMTNTNIRTQDFKSQRRKTHWGIGT